MQKNFIFILKNISYYNYVILGGLSINLAHQPNPTLVGFSMQE